jgi:hypothetical protein
MKESGCNFSCTDGLIGEDLYNPNNNYKKYNAEYNYSILQDIYRQKESNLLENGFPKIWNLEFLKIHNCITSSSVIIDTKILVKINKFISTKNNKGEYDCWLRTLEHTNCIYISDDFGKSWTKNGLSGSNIYNFIFISDVNDSLPHS